jgi:hemolysin III
MDQQHGSAQAATLDHSEHGVSHAPVSKAIYGLISVLAVLQVLELHPPTALQATVALFGTTVAVALADAYSESVAEMLAKRHSLTLDDLRKIGRDVAPVMTGAQAPTVVLLASALGLISLDLALTLAQIVAFALLFGYGWRVGQLLHEHWARQLASGLFLLAIGGLAVGIKTAFH